MIYIKIAVLAGGTSPERRVSLCSGKNIALSLIRNRHTAALIDPSKPVSLSEKLFTQDELDIQARFELLSDSSPKLDSPELDMSVIFVLKHCDRVFLALHGGSGEDGHIQAMLDLLGIPYNGSTSLGCAVSMDKLMTKRLLSEAGILTPSYTVSRRGESVVPPPRYPCVVKPANGGSSIGISFSSTPAEHNFAVANAHKYCTEALSEEAIRGRELTVGVLNDEPLAVTEILPNSGFYDYENKYTAGKTLEVTPADLPKEVTARALTIAKRCHDLLGLKNFSRTDIIYDETSGLLYTLEVNALPGMTDTSLLPQMAKYRNIGFDELCERMM